MTVPDPNKKNLVLFASGAGSNAKQIINYFQGSEKARVALVVCNKPGAGVIEVAEQAGIPLLMIEKDRFFNGDGYTRELKAVSADLLVLAGFLWKVPQTLIDAYPRAIINIHPALLPKFGGKGMYGQYVHQSVINSGEVESGITIHYVDEHYDNGDIIFQTGCPVLPGDSTETLAQRVHLLEHMHYARVVDGLLENS
jgi:phosphoribosylglycinamide formyltransferase 1